ncbi:SulP family inorganic anion transporter [Paracoccus alkenifer]|uniref:Sulfate permease, SulP family n=1 Tax=Paracoccus alkenifer TaxID=65735 RepID=A0A1H6KCP4_9RHOB|nr:SulP family inorganic anion transporter [Paracoccus alkenifer]SEH70944.1 sulfate permease, SulP family [Paracoccus alkenifer]
MLTPKIVTMLKDYDAPTLRADVLAGITVAMVALPLSLAIAIASGAPPATGPVTAIVAGLLISIFGGSRVQIGGPTGAFIVVVYSVIQNHGLDGLLIATLMAGALLVLAALLRVGGLIRLIPEPVISGFTIGIAVIIAASQIADFFGLETGAVPAAMLEKIPVLWQARASAGWADVGVGLFTLALIVVLRRAAPRLPGLIVAIAAGSALVAAFGLPVETLGSQFGELPRTLPAPALPAGITLARMGALLPSALTIAFLAGIESLLSAMVADRLVGGQHRPNAEIMAQGIANIGSVFFGGLPATGAIARTATNVRAGGRTPVAGVVHALAILLVMLLAAPLAGYLAMPALAAVLVLTAWNMAEPGRWGEYLRARRGDRAVLLLTLALTVFTDLTIAIAAGTIAGLLVRMNRRGLPPAGWTPPRR